MENMPLISVIIPVFNVESYLEECINSVINQTYKNIEIILVDDGSTDSSGEICDKYADEHNFVHVIHQQNGGLSAARNSGFEKATGKYVYFLDSDDYLSVDAMNKLCNIAEMNCSDVVFFDALSFSDDDSFQVKQNYIRKNKYFSSKGIEIFSQLQKNGEFHSSVPLLFLKRDFINNNCLRFVQEIFYEDMVFTFEVLCLANVVSQCEESLYNRRYRQNSIMTTHKSKKYLDSAIAVYENVRDFANIHNLTENNAVKKYIVRNAFNVFNNFEKLSASEKSQCKKTMADVKEDILKNNAYDDTALKMRCYNKLMWAGYKVTEKLSGK